MPSNAVTDDLIARIDRSPSPYHAVAEGSSQLLEHGFVELDERARWDPATVDRAFVRRGGSLVAWTRPDTWTPGDPARIVGAHTDSPNLRVKPRPDTGSAGFRQLGVEVYGGVLLNSWLDRDLGLSGRVGLRDGGVTTTRLFCHDEPLLRIPQLAIHLDRDINERGLKLNKQAHLRPIWGIGAPHEGDLREFIAAHLDVEASDVLTWELMCHDVAKGTVTGRDHELVSIARIDNLASCFTALQALTQPDRRGSSLALVCLYDHEEVGSTSSTGADSTMLATLLERVVLASGGDRADLLRTAAGSRCVSADGAHATNPNYTERHDPEHTVALNAGPVVKINANQRYATEASGAAAFLLACEKADVPVQHFVSRSDMPCGSTIGPVTAARLGIETVDVGIPQLAMHSAREMCGTDDPALFTRALSAFFA